MAETSTDVVLVDDHALMRSGIRAILESVPGFRICAEASSGEEALEILQRTPAQVVLLDIGLPGMSGLEVASRLRTDHPDLKVLILSMHADEDHAFQALSAGVAGYVIKDASVNELETALRTVLRGETYLSPALSRRVMDVLRRGGPPRPEPDPLTPRQREVLVRIAQGASTKEIAWDLGLSVKTIETHRAQIMERLKIQDVAGLVRYAVRKGLVSA